MNAGRWVIFAISFFLLSGLWLNSMNYFRFKLAKLYERRDNLNQAIRTYNKIYRKENALSNSSRRFYKLAFADKYEINKKLADFFFNIKDKEKASEHYKIIKALKPQDIQNYLNLYILNQDATDLVEIVLNSKDPDLREFLPSEYTESPFWRYSLVLGLIKRNRWVEAEGILNGLISEYPYSSTFQNCLEFVKQRKISPYPVFDIVGIWRFDEGVGNKAKDYSGRWNDGIICGAKWVNGLFGKALSFDGVNDYVFVLRNDSLNLKNFTFCVWIKPLGFPEHTSLIIRNGISGGHIAIHKNALLSAGFYDGFTWQILQGGQYKLNEWTFIIAVLNNGILSIYKDGELILKPKDTASHPTISCDDLFFGKREDYLGHFKGIIDEMQIFSRALSDKEIKQLYQQYYISKNRI